MKKSRKLIIDALCDTFQKDGIHRANKPKILFRKTHSVPADVLFLFFLSSSRPIQTSTNKLATLFGFLENSTFYGWFECLRCVHCVVLCSVLCTYIIIYSRKWKFKRWKYSLENELHASLCWLVMLKLNKCMLAHTTMCVCECVCAIFSIFWHCYFK